MPCCVRVPQLRFAPDFRGKIRTTYEGKIGLIFVNKSRNVGKFRAEKIGITLVIFLTYHAKNILELLCNMNFI